MDIESIKTGLTIKKIYYFIMTLISITLLICHTFNLLNIEVNEITLALLGISLIIPILDNIDKIKIGNFLEAELHKKAVQAYETTTKSISKEKVEGVTTSTIQKQLAYNVTPPKKKEEVDPRLYKYVDLREISKISIIAGIVKLREYLNDSLYELYSINHPKSSIKSDTPRAYIQPLVEDGDITPEIGRSINQILDIANYAVHNSEKITTEDIKLATLAGLNILTVLDDIFIRKSKKQ